VATSIANLLTSIRYRLVDPEKSNWSDAELTSYLTDGNRALFFTVANLRPEFVRTGQTGTTVSGEKAIAITGGPILRDLRVWIGPEKERLQSMELHELPSLHRVGKPEFFWASGFSSVDLYPVPDGEYEYTLSYIPQPAILEENSPWPESFDGFLVEFAVVRAGLRDEADMTQEAGFMSSWQQRIAEAIGAVHPGEGVIGGYW